MFRDNQLASLEVLASMSTAFLPWVRERLANGRYVGLLTMDREQAIVAGAGMFFADFPPHWRHSEAVRRYVLNVFTEDTYRGCGLAKELIRRMLEECRQRQTTTVTLHASPQGRPMYESLGFFGSDEMLLTLQRESGPL